ncbi:MAG: DegT/DnrJ/EryC1/StrS family aminotransferase [Deltaproteobacteria bacterium]|nr:DegT/DnrJ/EryC1/StrS family aminotransferase [Deltaproteobacteria bacterium]MBW2724930.1 DegT/DnrJ/EryC1/StrS family aminotransferase [Deltaproteobacteria bacterium]
MDIPLVDLAIQHREIADEIKRGFEEVFERTSFIHGPAVAEFERAFAKFSGVRHCVGVGSGTDAIELILRAQGIGNGDEVIVPANTFIATPLAVTRVGAVPVFVDSDPIYHLIDVSKVKACINKRTRGILAVDLYGQVAPFEILEDLARGRGIAVIEDAAQSHGAVRNGCRAGGFGVAAATSFYPGKNLGAYGDAGAVLTNDDDFAEAVRQLGNWGGTVKYQHPRVGFNSRLDSLQAVVLRAKLERLPRWNDERRAAAARYEGLLGASGDLVLPEVQADGEAVWHLYVVRVPERDRVLARLNDAGIGAGIHYPTPCHLQGAYASLGHSRGSFPVAEQAADEILSLPIYPGITEQQQERVAEVLLRSI